MDLRMKSDKISGHTHTHARLLDKRIVLSNQNDILHENFHNNAQFNTADNNKNGEEDVMEKINIYVCVCVCAY